MKTTVPFPVPLAPEVIVMKASLLAAVSNNINQIAVAANVTGETADELEATLRAVRRVTGRVEGVVRAVEEESR